jgi:tetratricopeptide (TPR) repeat protein
MNANEEMVMPAVLGDRIREARSRLNMTQGELAGNDYSVSYISAIERNKIRPSLRALAWLASRLNVNVSDLLASDAPLPGDLSLAQSTEDAFTLALTEARLALATHRAAEAYEGLHQVQEQIRTTSQRVQHALLLAEASLALHRGTEAKDLMEANLQLTKDGDTLAHERSRNLLGLAYSELHLYMMAAECHRQCLNAIQSDLVRDPSFELAVMNNLGATYMQLGQFDEAISIFQQADTLGQKLQSPISLAELYWEISKRYRQDGLLSQAQRYTDLAIEHLQQADNRQTFIRLQSNLGSAYAEQSENERAEATLQHAKELAIQNGDAKSATLALAQLARVQIARGAISEAQSTAQQALADADKMGDTVARGYANLVMGEALAHTKQSGKAEEFFSTGIRLLEETTAPQSELSRAYARYAEYLEQRGEVKRALEYFKKAHTNLAASR